MSTAASPEPGLAALRGFSRELEDLRKLVHDRWQKHALLGSIYSAASNVLLIVGIAATAVAGITAAGNLLGQSVVGAIAMSAAVLTAIGAGLPWDQRARDHQNVASRYLSLRSDIAVRLAEIETGELQLSVAEWAKVFEELTRQREGIERLASDIPILHGREGGMGRSAPPSTPSN